jgi:endogenous inhibitor of DNA gyrase (YacG/DUF329 family)
MLTQVRCPACRRLTSLADNPHRPFCSERCRLRDLGNWASERYRIPGPVADESTQDGGADDDDPEPH